MGISFGVEAIGACGGILTTISFVPQVVKVVRERKTAGISLPMYVAFVAGTALWLSYGLAIKSFSVTLANLITLFLASGVLFMKLHVDYGLLNRNFRSDKGVQPQALP